MRSPDCLPSSRGYPEHLRAAGYYCTNNAKTDYNCDLDPAHVWDDNGATAHWKNRPPGKPFLAVFNFMTTHESRLFRPTPGRVSPEQVRVPAYLPDTPEIRQDFTSYYNLIERMDAQVGEKIAELTEAGLADDTVIFYFSDNGGVLPRSKRYCFDEGLRCALVVHVPSKWRRLAPAAPGSEISTPVSFIDFAPTLLSIAGLDTPAVMQGRAFLGRRVARPDRYAFGMRNRMDERYDFVRTVTDGRYRYIRNYMPNRPWGQHGAFEWMAKGYQSWEREFRAGRLNANQARFFREKPFEELYDLKTDIDQVANIVGDPAHATELAHLRAALDRHLVAITDNGFIPEGMAQEGYVSSRDPAQYPLPRVMQIASVAARRDAGNLVILEHALAESNDVVRYWAAMGMLMLEHEARNAVEKLGVMMRDDPSTHIRIVAAEAVGRLDPASGAVGVLAGILDGGDPWPVQLQALNALTFVGPSAKEAMPAIERAAQRDQEYIRSAGRYLKMVLDQTYAPDSQVFDLEFAARLRGAGAP